MLDACYVDSPPSDNIIVLEVGSVEACIMAPSRVALFVFKIQLLPGWQVLLPGWQVLEKHAEQPAVLCVLQHA
jgi:hypothetical protein